MQLFSFKQSFLKQQRVRKRSAKKKRNKKRIKIFFLLPTFVLLILGIAFFLTTQKNKETFFSTQINEGWTISSSTSGVLQDPQDPIASGLLKKQTLQELVTNLQKSDYYNQITIIQTAPKRIHLDTNLRQPVLAVSVDKLRNLSKRGFVYGQAETDSLPLLTGVFNRKSNSYKLSNINALVITEQEEAKIKDALAVLKASNLYNLQLKEIKFTPYRGYSILLDKGTRLVLGSRPFDYKIKKFIELKKSLAKEQKSITYMELDYRGKAFIKTERTGV